MVPVGLGIPTAVIVGNNIGAMNLDVAKYFAKLCVAIGFIWGMCSVLAVLVFKNYLI